MITIMRDNLQIVQYDTWKTKYEVMATFLWAHKALQADVIAIQEHWANGKTQTTHQPPSRTHQLLYPERKDFGEGRAGVCS
jgi:hypothetical protein